MQSREIRQYDNAKKASGSSNRSDIGKKYQTHEDRCSYYDRFLQSYEKGGGPQIEKKSQLEIANHDESGKSSWHDWVGQVRDKVSGMVSSLWENKSALLLGAMLASARGISVEGRPVRGGTALRLLDSNNATNLPSLGWEGFNNFSHPTALAFNPNKVTPELLDHLSKFMKNPEQLIQNMQQREQKQKNRWLAKKAQENPDVLESLRKLFEEMPGKESGETPQSSMEIHQGEQDKGKELIKLEEVKMASLQARKEEVKANRKVLERVVNLLAERRQLREQESSVPQRELETPIPHNWGASVVFVHGLNGPSSKTSGNGFDCNNEYWKLAREFLTPRWQGDLRFIKYYTGDHDCINGNEKRFTSDLHDPLYKSHCTNYHADAGPEGTNDESLYHLSCLFSQYLYDNFGQFNRPVILVGHSLGGIIIRETLYQMQEHAGQSPFPTTIGHVSDAVTFDTPHSGGVPLVDHFACSGCTQVAELNGDFMSELKKSGRNPQTPGGTDWTVIGSECDIVARAASAIDMDASRAVVYQLGTNTCYGHNDAINDNSPTRDSRQYYCDTSDLGNIPCGTSAYDVNWEHRDDGPHGLLYMYNAISHFS
jgi:pimeloyl-ACP methyl ester carboxylesterase